MPFAQAYNFAAALSLLGTGLVGSSDEAQAVVGAKMRSSLRFLSHFLVGLKCLLYLCGVRVGFMAVLYL